MVKSQTRSTPFHVNVYMTGSTYGAGNGGARTTGDPDFVNVPPADQYLDRYVFFTDFTFPETSLTVVRRKTATGFVPVELECAGPISGWQPLGSSGKYEFAWVKLTSGFTNQKFPQGRVHLRPSGGPQHRRLRGDGLGHGHRRELRLRGRHGPSSHQRREAAGRSLAPARHHVRWCHLPERTGVRTQMG